MQRNERKFNRSEQDDHLNYQKGYRDGIQDAFDKSELDAYYAGVGYAKKASGDKHIGFNSDKERQEFEKGIANKDKHFKSYRAEPPSFWERLFGAKKESRKDVIKVTDRRKETEARVKKNWNGGRDADSYLIDHFMHNEIKRKGLKAEREKKSSQRNTRKKQKKFIKQYKRKK